MTFLTAFANVLIPEFFEELVGNDVGAELFCVAKYSEILVLITDVSAVRLTSIESVFR